MKEYYPIQIGKTSTTNQGVKITTGSEDNHDGNYSFLYE